jgi:hypothetical protein
MQSVSFRQATNIDILKSVLCARITYVGELDNELLFVPVKQARGSV